MKTCLKCGQANADWATECGRCNKPLVTSLLSCDIDAVRSSVGSRAEADLIEQIIKLYAKELEQANELIHNQSVQLKADNLMLEELRRLAVQQKSVIDTLSAKITALPKVTDAIREAQARVSIETNDGSGFWRDLATLCDFIERYDQAQHEHESQRDSADGCADAERQKAEA
jgi:hypothetical protein